jgi:hypothetical protein
MFKLQSMYPCPRGGRSPKSCGDGASIHKLKPEVDVYNPGECEKVVLLIDGPLKKSLLLRTCSWKVVVPDGVPPVYHWPFSNTPAEALETA